MTCKFYFVGMKYENSPKISSENNAFIHGQENDEILATMLVSKSKDTIKKKYAFV